MSSANLDPLKLNDLFFIVGFEGQPEEANIANQNVEANKQNNDFQKHELDPDIADLLNNTDENTESKIESFEEGEDDNEETYSFLDEPSESKSSRLSSRIKQHTEQKEVISVENNILPSNLIFNINIDESKLNEIIHRLGEESQVDDESMSFLDEQKQSSRLMSRIKQHEIKEIETIENYTIPDQIIFNLNISESRIKELFKDLGEDVSNSKTDSTFLEEQSKNSRLMSRIKQHEVKEVISIENYTIPKTLRFNFNLPEKQLKHILHSVGD
ncbi:MAG: hypothetical protein OEV44_13140 [Spirochaetota bacterium]|nr:hypothetical protein [Spirochaetota bacterium]